MVGNQAAAVLEFFSNEITEPDKPFLDLMSNIGTQLGRVVEREQAEEELRHSQEQLAEAQKIASIGSWDWDLSARSVHWSEEIYRIYGVKPGEFKADYEGFMQMIHPDDREAITREANRAIQERKPYNIEHRIFRPDGSQRTIYAQGNLILDEDNQPVKMVGICQDITERREMEEALRESLFMFENLFESAPDGTVLVDQDGLILRANRQIEDIFGYQRTELIGKPLETLLPDRYRIGHSLRRGSFSKDPQLRPMGAGLELYGRRSDGTEFPVDIMLSPLKTDQGLQVIAVVRDITERRRAEEALRQSEARFRSVFEGNAFGMAVVDLKGRILLSNPRLSEILGYPQAELRVLTSSSLTFPADIHATEKMYQDMLEGRQDATQLEKRYIRKDGQVIWARLTISLVRNSNDAPHFAIAMVEDITSRKQMEAELAEVKHRLMVGREQERIRLAQELHDAPLQDLYVVLYQLNDLEESIGDPEQFRQLKNSQAETIRQVISTLRSIMGELRSPTLSPFGLAGAIREHSEQFQAKFPLLMLHLDLENDDQDLSEEVRLNLFRIYQQALTNVIRHAQAQNVTIRFSYNENKIVLEIEDDGLGFEVPARWLRLAREGHLGLAGASERAEMMGGRLQVISKPGKGTLLRVEVPRKFEPIL
jgi:PAS domain S-box-containing protein